MADAEQLCLTSQIASTVELLSRPTTELAVGGSALNQTAELLSRLALELL